MSTEDRPKYWGVYKDEGVIFRGTHTECWNYLTSTFANVKVSELVENGVKIARTN